MLLDGGKIEMKKLLLVGLIILFISSLNILFAKSGVGAEAIVTWQAGSESDLAGYRVYWGSASRGSAIAVSDFNYGNTQDVGTQTSHIITNLIEGQTVYGAVTAYDTSNNESLYSNEASAFIADVTSPGVPQGVQIIITININP
jgi:hypothetical protein